jgi:hypothetical protein
MVIERGCTAAKADPCMARIIQITTKDWVKERAKPHNPKTVNETTKTNLLPKRSANSPVGKASRALDRKYMLLTIPISESDNPSVRCISGRAGRMGAIPVRITPELKIVSHIGARPTGEALIQIVLFDCF